LYVANDAELRREITRVVIPSVSIRTGVTAGVVILAWWTADQLDILFELLKSSILPHC
jgi:hypothetical protein